MQMLGKQHDMSYSVIEMQVMQRCLYYYSSIQLSCRTWNFISPVVFSSG